MTTTTFDSLAYFERLKAAGFTEAQARAQAEILREHAEALTGAQKKELATKGDIADVRLEIEKVRAEIKDTELRLLKWQWGIAVALAAIMAKGFGWLGF